MPEARPRSAQSTVAILRAFPKIRLVGLCFSSWVCKVVAMNFMMQESSCQQEDGRAPQLCCALSGGRGLLPHPGRTLSGQDLPIRPRLRHRLQTAHWLGLPALPPGALHYLVPPSPWSCHQVDPPSSPHLHQSSLTGEQLFHAISSVGSMLGAPGETVGTQFHVLE